MAREPDQIRTVEDAGDEAVALFRKIDVERAEHPDSRPALIERFTARVTDLVVHAVTVIVATPGIYLALGDKAVRDGRPVAAATVPGTPSWGPVVIGWETILTLSVFIGGVAISEAMQTKILGATVGKRRNDIRVVDAHGGGPASLLQVGIRGAVLAAPFAIIAGFWFVSILYLLAGVALLAFISIRVLRDDRQQGPHDKLARTEVFSTDVRS